VTWPAGTSGVTGIVQENGNDAILVAYRDTDGNEHWQLEKVWQLELAF
jgi:hypothetical protein